MFTTVLIAAVSADGKIADARGDQSALTNDADRAHLKSYIKSSDLLLLGRRTYEEHQAKLGGYRCAVITTQVREPKLNNMGHLLWNPIHTKFEEVIERFGAKSLCILGGSKLYSLAKTSGWVDKLVLTYVPEVTLVGGLPLFQDTPDKEVWSKLDQGAIGFRPDAAPEILRGCEGMKFPFQLRQFVKVP